MQFVSAALRRVVLTSLSLALVVPGMKAQDSTNAGFTYSTFTVPGAVHLSIESVNDSGTASGYYSDSSGDYISFLRTSGGTETTYLEPANTGLPSYTLGGQINLNGAVAGYFLDTATGTVEGYVYRTSAGTFTIYQVPGQPQYTSTGLQGINAKGNLCGYVYPPPYAVSSAFIEVGGQVTILSVNGSASTLCNSISDNGTTVGTYTDGAGAYHGWTRSPSGIITVIDVPGASSTPGTAPCLSTPVAGTVILGINHAGYMSGHYWDSAYNEHGFIRTPTGTFYHLNVPGAFQTSAGGLNDHLEIVGHYTDSACNEFGYTAQ